MSVYKVEICGVDTSSLPVLKNERMRELFPLVHAGDKAARDEFISGNLRLVLSVIARFTRGGTGGRGKGAPNADDLFQVGCIGLIKAIDNFDTDKDVRFSTYAVPMIIGEIRRYLRDNNPIRVSRSLRDTAYKAMQAQGALQAKLGREPTLDEIAAEIGVDAENVYLAMESTYDPVSLYDPVYQDGGDAICVIDQVQDNAVSTEGWTTQIALKNAIGRLDERERMIVMKRFFAGKTQMEVAQEIGISQAQVSRLEKAALKEMRRYV